MRNSFGIFVIHKALILAENDQKITLSKKVGDSIGLLSNKKLKAKWCQILEESNSGTSKSLSGFCHEENDIPDYPD